MQDVTRRSFVRLAVGTLTSLPVLAGGLVVGPPTARATEGDKVASEYPIGGPSEPTVIDVVMPWEVGFMVIDVTKGTENEAGMVSYPPVAGATVTVTSRYNGKVARGTTDADGVANLDIKALSVEPGSAGDDTDVPEYYLNGSVSVTKDGFRTFQTGCVLIEGGSGLRVPAHPMDDTVMPYPHLTTFDDWDCLYSANEFAVTPKNEEDHTVSVVVAGVATGETASIELWVEGEKEARASAAATVESGYPLGMKGSATIKGTVARASFKGSFLKEGDDAALPVGATLAVTMAYQGNTYSWPLALTISEAVTDEPQERPKVKLSPINVTAGSAFDIKWPTDAPLVGGGFLKFWVPELPINIYVNPYGYVQLTLKSPSWGYLNDFGASDKKGWGGYPRKSVADQWKKKVDTLKKMADKTNALVSKPGAIQQLDLFRSFSFMLNLQLVALAKWDTKQGLFQGEVAGQALATLNFTLTENFFAGPIPVLVTFSIDTSLIFSLAASCYSPKKSKDEDILDAIGDFSRWKWDYTNGLALTLSVTPALSVGIGIRGAASISVKGAFTFTLYLGVPFTDAPKGGSPHYMAGWSAIISLVLEFFFFTKSFALFNQKYTPFYDSWSSGDYVTQGDAGLSPKSLLKNKTLTDVTSELNIITDEMMADTCEFASTGDTAAAATVQSEPWGSLEPIERLTRSFDEMEAAATTRVVEAADGTPVTYTVMSFGGRLGSEPAGGAAEARADQQDGVATLATEADGAPVEATETVGAVQSYARETGVGYVRLSPQSEEAADLPEAGVAGLGPLGGLRPSSDTPLVTKANGEPADVFGDPHVKVLDISYLNTQDGKYIDLSTRAMFRLATVDVGGGRIRTRVVVTRLAGDSFKGGSTSLVVETITDEGSSRYLDHAPLYDYDFDVDTLYKNEQFKVYGAQGARDATLGVQDKYASGLFEYHVLNIVVLSGARADGDDTSLPKAATDLVFTVLNIPAYVLFGYDYDGRKVTGDPGVLRPTGLFDQVTMPGKGAIGSNPDDFHSVSNIRLRTVNSLYNPASCFICLLDRVGKSAEQTVSEQADPHLGVLIIDWFSGEIARPDLSAFDIGDFDSSVYELVVHPLTLWTTKSAYTLMLRGAETASYVLMSVNTRMGSVDFLVRCEDYDPNVRLVPWPGHDCFLASFPNDDSALGAGPDEHDYAQWTLHQLNWSDDPKPRLVGDKVGPQGFNVGNFACNPAGSFLFWPQSREVDEDRVYDPDGVEDVCVRPSTYHIKGSRIRESHFSDPFIVADLASDTDDLVVVDTLARTPLVAVRTELVPSTISDGKGGQVPKYTDDEGQTIYSAAHLFYTEVPTVRCATPVSCEAPNPFVTPGGSIEFHVALRNDGNVFLSGCTLSMWLLDEATDSYDLVDEALAQLVFDEESLQESNYNRRGDDGALEDVEPDYALCPGKTSVYSVSVTVPKTWEEGPKHVLFVAYDARVSPDPALSPLQQQASAQSDTFPQAPDPNDGVLEFHVEPGDIDFVPIRTAPSSHQDANPRHMETIHVLQPTVAGDFMPAPVRESDTNGTPDVVPVRRVTPNGQGGPSWNGLGGRTSSLPSGSLPSGVASRTWRSDGHGWTGSTGSPSAGASMSSAAGATTSPAASQYVGQTVSGVTAPAPAAGASGATATGASTAQTAPSSRLVSGAGGLAHTGDDGGSGALAAGIAAIGAAALAYERRRARNERG